MARRRNFISDFFGYLESCESEYLCGMVDDCVVYKMTPAGQTSLSKIMKDDSVFCFSLRMGANVTLQNYLRPDVVVELKNLNQMTSVLDGTGESG